MFHRPRSCSWRFLPPTFSISRPEFSWTRFSIAILPWFVRVASWRLPPSTQRAPPPKIEGNEQLFEAWCGLCGMWNVFAWFYCDNNIMIIVLWPCGKIENDCIFWCHLLFLYNDGVMTWHRWCVKRGYSNITVMPCGWIPRDHLLFWKKGCSANENTIIFSINPLNQRLILW